MNRWIELDSNRKERYPTSRSFHTTTKFENSLILFGGITGETDQAEFLNDLWVSQENNKSWRNDLLIFSGTSNTPSPRCRHTAVALKYGIYIYGGTTDEEPDSNIYLLQKTKTEKYRWIRLNAIGNEPTPRFGHCCESINDTSFIIFGGISLIDQKPLNDMYSFDALKNVWMKIDIERLPSPGCDYSLLRFCSNNEFVIVGSHSTNDTGSIRAWYLRILEKRWKCSEIRFSGCRGNIFKQVIGSASFRTELGLLQLSTEGKKSLDNSQTKLIKFSYFPSDRWFSTCFHHSGFIYLIGGMKKKTGEKPSTSAIWRFSCLSLKESRFVSWECIRIENSFKIPSRVGWSITMFPDNKNQFFVFGGTEVSNVLQTDINPNRLQRLEEEYGPIRIYREIIDLPAILCFNHFASFEAISFQKNKKQISSDKVVFVCPNFLIRITGGILYKEEIPKLNFSSSSTFCNSFSNFVIFDGNKIFSLTRDASLLATFQPDSKTNKEWIKITKPFSTIINNKNDVTEEDDLFGKSNSFLSTPWPDDSLEGQALVRFCPNFYYLQNRQFFKDEAPFRGDVLVIMGGISKPSGKAAKVLGSDEIDSKVSNEIWMAYSSFRNSTYDIPTATTCNWKRLWPPSSVAGLEISNPACIEGRYLHSLTTLPALGCLVAYGGLSASSKAPLSSTLLIDFTSPNPRDFANVTITVPITSGMEPKNRFGHSAAATYDEAPRLVICGGNSVENPSIVFHDVHIWDVTTGFWSEVILDFPVRSVGSLKIIDNEFYFFQEIEEEQVFKFSLK